jgi:N-acetylmuramidase
MAMLPFQLAALALSSDGLNAAAANIGVHAPEVWTVLGVETSGCGFLLDRRPQILFERHIFHRLTGGRYDDGQISDPTAGGYGAYGAHQYDRLALAIAKDRNAALQSASWGIGQIMGMNFRVAGFSNVEDMVAAVCASEELQLGAFANSCWAPGWRQLCNRTTGQPSPAATTEAITPSIGMMSGSRENSRNTRSVHCPI